MIKIGICLQSLGSSFRTALAQAQRMGAGGVEIPALGDFSPRQLSQTGRRELMHLLRSHNLELTALYCPLRHGLNVPANQQARIEYLRDALSLAFELGPRIVVTQPGKLVLDEKDPGVPLLREALGDLGKHGDRVGSFLALETGLDAPPQLDAYLNSFDCGSLTLNYSPANLLLRGFNPYEAARLWHRRIVHVHARDARISSAQEVPLGHGDIDWLALADTLREVEYGGWVDVERNGGQDPVRDIAAGVGFLKKML